MWLQSPKYSNDIDTVCFQTSTLIKSNKIFSSWQPSQVVRTNHMSRDRFLLHHQNPPESVNAYRCQYLHCCVTGSHANAPSTPVTTSFLMLTLRSLTLSQTLLPHPYCYCTYFAAGVIDQTVAPMPRGLYTTSGDVPRCSDGPSQVFTVSD